MKSFFREMTLGVETLGEARHWVVGRVKDCAVGSGVDLLSAEIAVGEVLQNIIRYAYEGAGPITLRVSDLDEAVAITVFDEALPSDPDSWLADKLATDGGLGLSVIGNAVDAYSFRPLIAGNRASIYFFPNHSDFAVCSLKWAGELLEARASDEEISSWIEICESGGLVEPRVIEALKICGRALGEHERELASLPEYHNTKHFLDVFISTIHWVEANRVDHHAACVLLVAALMHDYKHPGELINLRGADQSVEALSAAFFRQLFSESPALHTDEIELVCKIILDTQPSQRNSPEISGLSLVFNALDVGASFVPWHGITQTRALLAEQNISADNLFVYRTFINENGNLVRKQCPVIAPWVDLSIVLG